MTSPDRLKAALEDLFQLMLPQLVYYVQWPARVLVATPAAPPATAGPAVFASPATVNCAITDARALAVLGPQFQNIAVPIWADASGLVCVPAVGSLVRVGFVGGSAQDPYIAGIDPQNLPTLSVGVALRALAATGGTGWAAFATAMGTLG